MANPAGLCRQQTDTILISESPNMLMLQPRDSVVVMLEKVFWFISVFFFGLAVYLANASSGAAQSVTLDYPFWVAITLGTVSAAIGNVLKASNSLDAAADDDQHHSPANR